jgi:riboflavin kinase/FMN adenylyltransferase
MKNVKSIAIGGFDGMHLGHQHLFAELGDNGVIVVIETGYANLTPKKERERFSSFKIIYYDLEDIRHLDGEGFIKLLNSKFPDLEKIVVGYDFHFGKNRKYSFNDLKDLFDGDVVVIDEVSFNGDSIHSHKIRAKLSIGDVKGANSFLGHNYTIRGEHIKGQGIGKKELVATINIKTEGYLLPKEGVYATLTQINNEEHFHPSVSFLGHRKTTDGKYAIETHILDGEVRCKSDVSISFVSYIRENKTFENLDELKDAINKDVAIASKELKLLQL